MSHIHIPDGILPVWLWLFGIIAVAAYFLFFSIYIKKHNKNNKIMLVGIFAALMMLAMSIEIVPISYHVNLSALSGIILGPVYAPLAILASNLFLSLMGHGGITVVGLNTIAVSAEALSAFFIFKFLRKKINIFASAFTATFLALLISAGISIGITYLGTGNFAPEHNHEHETSTGFIKFEGKETEHHDKNAEHQEDHDENFDIKRFALLVAMFGSIGWTLESSLTAFIIRYISKVKPDILED